MFQKLAVAAILSGIGGGAYAAPPELIEFGRPMSLAGSSLQSIRDVSPAGSAGVLAEHGSPHMRVSANSLLPSSTPVRVHGFAGFTPDYRFGTLGSGSTPRLGAVTLEERAAFLGSMTLNFVGKDVMTAWGSCEGSDWSTFAGAVSPDPARFWVDGSSMRSEHLGRLYLLNGSAYQAVGTGAVASEDKPYKSADNELNDFVNRIESVTAAVPEPSTYAMMLAGIGILGFMARRRLNG